MTTSMTTDHLINIRRVPLTRGSVASTPLVAIDLAALFDQVWDLGRGGAGPNTHDNRMARIRSGSNESGRLAGVLAGHGAEPSQSFERGKVDPRAAELSWAARSTSDGYSPRCAL